MKIEVLIARLEAIRDEFGDIDVLVDIDDDGMYRFTAEVCEEGFEPVVFLELATAD